MADQNLSGAANRFQRDVSGAVAQLGFGEKFAVLGAVGVLVVWAIMDLLIDRYGVGHLPFALALVVAYAAYRYHVGGARGWAVPYSTIVFAGAGLLGVIGAWMAVEEIRNSILDAGAATVLGAIAYWAASIVAGIGALQMRSRSG